MCTCFIELINKFINSINKFCKKNKVLKKKDVKRNEFLNVRFLP